MVLQQFNYTPKISVMVKENLILFTDVLSH